MLLHGEGADQLTNQQIFSSADLACLSLPIFPRRDMYTRCIAKQALKRKLVPNVIFLVAMWKRKLVLKMSWSFNMLNYFDNWKLWQAAPNSLSYVRCHLNSYQKCDFMFSRQCVRHGVWADVLVVGGGEEMHPIWILNPDMPVSPHLIMWRNTWYGKSVTTVFKFHMYHEQLLPHGNHTFFLSVLLPNFDLIPWSW